MASLIGGMLPRSVIVINGVSVCVYVEGGWIVIAIKAYRIVRGEEDRLAQR